MITYTQLYKRAADIIGVSAGTNSQALVNIQQDINQGLRIFKNASRRYWSRKEVTTDLKKNQQYYTFPEDMVRITTVKVASGGLVIPVTLVDSEEMWNRVNLVPAMTVGVPTMGFIRGRDELGLYPIPANDIVGGLIVSYEPRMKDMTIDDTTPSVNVVNNSNTVTAATGTPFTANMIGLWFSVTDGSDGYWYQITGVPDTTHLTLENYYQDPTKNGATSVVGTVPDIPEDYHLALVYFACFNYYLKRKESATAAGFKSLFDAALKDYKSVYAAKTTGWTQNDLSTGQFNLFGLPPTNVTG